MTEPAKYLGLDFSTQQIKAVLTDEHLNVLHVEHVEFDSELPQFKAKFSISSLKHPFFEKEVSSYPEFYAETSNGVHKSEDGLRVTSPVQMWMEAFDLLLNKLQSSCPFSLASVRAISGAGQQHGSVFWAESGRKTLQNLNPESPLSKQLVNAYTRQDSPIWMDSSTGKQVKALESELGGAKTVCELTGSRAFHRFTGNQIAKIAEEEPDVYLATERISLVSSWAASLLIGDYAAIDLSDGAGMNLLDINTAQWSSAILQKSPVSLQQKLGAPIPSNIIIGKISGYYINRYGINSDCQVVAFTGDNPSSLAGLCLQEGDIAISLGTSDTVFVWMTEAKVDTGLHVFYNPIEPRQYMGMLCFKNGSLTRERIRKACDCQTWEEFNKLLQTTPPGNNGNLGFYYDSPEILPEVPAGDHRFRGADGKEVTDFGDKAVEARAVIEHGCLAKKHYANSVGFKEGGRVIVTGGASNNQEIVQILADVFASPVYKLSEPNSAALGGAIRAKQVTKSIPWPILVENMPQKPNLAARPRPEFVKVYQDMAEKFGALQSQL